MKKILIISGHPDLEQSLANKTILQTLEKSFGDEVAIHRLDQLYPDYQINVGIEQAALLAADIIVWQLPLQWYHLPALMKKWLDDVFVYGFAHGSTAKLGGKKLIVSFTTGAAAADYKVGGAMNYPLEDFLPALRQTALLCHLDWQPPIYCNGMAYIAGVSGKEDYDKVKNKAIATAEQLINQINKLRGK